MKLRITTSCLPFPEAAMTLPPGCFTDEAHPFVIHTGHSVTLVLIQFCLISSENICGSSHHFLHVASWFSGFLHMKSQSCSVFPFPTPLQCLPSSSQNEIWFILKLNSWDLTVARIHYPDGMLPFRRGKRNIRGRVYRRTYEQVYGWNSIQHIQQRRGAKEKDKKNGIRGNKFRGWTGWSEEGRRRANTVFAWCSKMLAYTLPIYS